MRVALAAGFALASLGASLVLARGREADVTGPADELTGPADRVAAAVPKVNVTGWNVGSERFRGISAVSDSVVWASGTKGTIVRTADGGQSWQTLPVPGAESLDFRDIDAFDARTAYALSIGAGDASRIYHTTDAGRTWILQHQNHDPKAFFDAMTFADARHGVVMSDSVEGQFVIMLTSDGGQQWSRAPVGGLPPALPNEGAFAASGTNVAVMGLDRVWIGTGAAASARVLRSRDGGKTWKVSATPLVSGASAGIFSIAFRDRMHGVVVGGDYKKESEAVDNVAYTEDGGVTWWPVREHGLSGFRSAVAYVAASKTSLVAIGPKGADFSRDDGHTWQPLDVEGMHTLSVARHGTTAWAAGERGRIVRMELRP